MSPRDDWPPRLRRAMDRPSTDRQAWSTKLAGVLIAAYLWVAYSDTLSTTTLAVGGLAPAIGGAVIGGLLAFVLLFLAPAMRGLRTRQPLMVVATSSFGVRGTVLVPGLLLGIVQIVWFAVAVHYAVDFNLRGLLSAGLIEPGDIRSGRATGPVSQSTVYAATAMFWGIAAALVATRFIRWIAALMVVYPIFIAIALAGAMSWAIPGLGAYRAAERSPALLAALDARPAFWEMLQLVFGFSASVAVQSVNWGSTLRDGRDVRRAGFVGVGLASTILATLAVLTVAGSIGRDEIAREQAGEGVLSTVPVDELDDPTNVATIRLPARPDAYTLGAVFEERIGGLAGGVALIVLGLGSLASAVYAAYAYSNRLESIRKRPRRWAWGVVGAVVAYPLMVTGLAENVPLVIDLTAGLVAPMLGVLTADALLDRGDWPGPGPDWRPEGLVGWGVGAAVGLLPIVSRMGLATDDLKWMPMAPAAYLIALAIVIGGAGVRALGSRAGRRG